MIDRLCGNVEILNPFKSITDTTIELKRWIPHYYSGASKMINFHKQDLEIVANEPKLGKDVVRLLKMSNEELHDEAQQIMIRKLGITKEMADELMQKFAILGELLKMQEKVK